MVIWLTPLNCPRGLCMTPKAPLHICIAFFYLDLFCSGFSKLTRNLTFIQFRKTALPLSLLLCSLRRKRNVYCILGFFYKLRFSYLPPGFTFISLWLFLLVCGYIIFSILVTSAKISYFLFNFLESESSTKATFALYINRCS